MNEDVEVTMVVNRRRSDNDAAEETSSCCCFRWTTRCQKAEELGAVTGGVRPLLSIQMSDDQETVTVNWEREMLMAEQRKDDR